MGEYISVHDIYRRSFDYWTYQLGDIGGDILQLGQNKAALKDAEAALGENPREVGASIVAGQAAAGLGQLKEAFLKYKIGLQQDPNNKVLNSVVV